MSEEWCKHMRGGAMTTRTIKFIFCRALKKPSRHTYQLGLCHRKVARSSLDHEATVVPAVAVDHGSSARGRRRTAPLRRAPFHWHPRELSCTRGTPLVRKFFRCGTPLVPSGSILYENTNSEFMCASLLMGQYELERSRLSGVGFPNRRLHLNGK